MLHPGLVGILTRRAPRWSGVCGGDADSDAAGGWTMRMHGDEICADGTWGLNYLLESRSVMAGT